LPCIFRVTPFVSDTALDARLARRGFVQFDRTLVQVLPLTALQLGHLHAVTATFRTQQDLTQAAAWLGEMRGECAPGIAALAARWTNSAARVEPVFAYDAAGKRVARSVTITEDGYSGVFDVGTLDAHRNRGYASALLAYQLRAARDAGAHTAYLQVAPENTSRRIYERFGFTTAYEYWYRALPQDAH
jgi:GNAT superfamily N-acetyltransferase